MRRHSLSTCIATALTIVVSLVAAGGAQAVVVDLNPAANGQSTVTYPTDQGSYYGVTLVPNTRGDLANTGIPTVTSSMTCSDPALTSDFSLPSGGMCSHGGPVAHANETFAFVWDPHPHSDYAAPYVEQFLRDVADGSGNLGSPFSIATQYTDGGGRAANSSLYGGGYDDSSGYPANGCAVSGTHHYASTPAGLVDVANDICLTDAQIKSELQSMVTQNGVIGRTQPGHTPVLVLLTPPGVETCLDSSGDLCSANSDPTQAPGSGPNPAPQFCSYHSQVNVGGTVLDYVVQPWSTQTGCDEPDAQPALPSGAVDPDTLARAMGARLVSPLSEAMIATMVNPSLNGWFALNGSEINDNGCVPLSLGLDKATVGPSTYYLQREFNNAGIMVDDPFVAACAPSVGLDPQFVVPSPIDAGDVVQFDGAESRSTLLVPRANFAWSFGDGTSAVGPSVVHSYARGGTFTVTLKVTDRGGNVAVTTQQVVVLGPSGQIVPPSLAPPTSQPAKSTAKPALSVRVALMPQGLKGILRSGLALNVTSNQSANGILTLSIPRRAAKRAHIRVGSGPAVVIGRGTVPGIHSGSNHLRVHLPKATATKLKRLRHVTVTIRLSLVAQGGHRITVDAAGHY
ncbi:MAG: PKD domain-containing protein [Solirubrobacteraceae bacterium]